MSLSMSVDEREAYLAGVHVGVLSVAGGGGRPPLTVPVWYEYEPGGEVRMITGRQSRKADLIRNEGRFSLCVQTEQVPYKYVTVEGSLVAIDEPTQPSLRRAIAERYLGPKGAERYIAATPNEAAESVTIRMKPERWLTADFTGAFGG